MKKKTNTLVTIPVLLIVVLVIFAGTFTANLIMGRVSFPDHDLGRTLTMEDGSSYEIFRCMQVAGAEGEKGQAVFTVCFQFSGLELAANKRLSLIPAPFLIGMEGFRAKYWTWDENSGYFQGLYQWESLSAAESYPESFIFKLMTKRAAEGTVKYEILPDTELEQYLTNLSSMERN